jgi:lipid-A-disaccharide synthase
MHDVLSTARFCLVASGTATLETAVFGVPMIILYRVSPITYALARLLVDIKHIGMVNILAGREVVPEHVQSIRVPHILPQALSLIDDTPARQQMLHDLDAVRQMLGGGGASQRAAQEILAVLNNGTP